MTATVTRVEEASAPSFRGHMQKVGGVNNILLPREKLVISSLLSFKPLLGHDIFMIPHEIVLLKSEFIVRVRNMSSFWVKNVG